MTPYMLTVGDDLSDIRGFTNTHIKCAVDRVAMLGGGCVALSAGTFAMADSLHLRTSVRVRGQGAATVLRKNAQKSSGVVAGLGYGHYDIVVADPDVFELGEGVWIRDDNAHGFYTTVGTLVRREGDTWFTTRPHQHDYSGERNGVVETLFPVVSAYDVDDATIEDLAIDGNKAANPTVITGCRGGGLFALRCKRLRVLRLTVRDCNTEGIGFQTCDDPEVAGCLVEHCTGNGFHPGSGTNRFHLHDCTARHNGASGLFYCLRVRDSLLANCTFEHNGEHGVSTGGRDSANVNRNLVIRDNAGCGFYMRPHHRNDAPHDNVIEGCTFERNASGADAPAEILIQGVVDGTRVLRSTIRRRADKPAVLIRHDAMSVEMTDNTFDPAAGAVLDQRPSGDGGRT